MFDLDLQDWFANPVVVNHFVKSLKKFAILRTASLSLERACLQRENWVTEKMGFAALLPFVVFHTQ